MDQAIKLNLGAGEPRYHVPGYENLDRKTGTEAYPLSGYADGSVEEIRASHVLEHFSHRDVSAVLAEWVRALKPGGTLKVAVPDFRHIAEGYLAGKPGKWQSYVMGGHSDANDHHGTTFDADNLYDLLERAGLVDIEPWVSEVEDCAALPVSLNLKGRKPLPTLPKVACVMSVPRLGFMSNFFAWIEALYPLGIRPVTFEGAFWGQCLERSMEEQLAEAEPPDWILTIDYDTFFTARDVRLMLQTVALHPEIDALAPVQMRRGGDGFPLVTMADGAGKRRQSVPLAEFDAPVTRVCTAHFGCTLIRASKLRAMPHPWFKGEPNGEGRWDEGRVDDDIYFWRKWAALGNSAYMANRVVVGHGEYLVMLPDENFKMIYQQPGDWRKSGPPANVRR